MEFADNSNYRAINNEYENTGGTDYIPNCPNCYHMMNEITELKMELNRIEKGEKSVKKTFTIAPTLYTFHHNGLSKRHLARSASLASSELLESSDDSDDTGYLENIIQQCYTSQPNPFFSTINFIQEYLFLCSEICMVSDYPPYFLGRVLENEPRLLRLKSPAYVFGDFHGNINDLMAFARTMWPLGIHLSPGTFLFLGDYVDRGMFGIEVLAYLFAQKMMLPDKVFLLRGNHEVKLVNGCDQYYGNRCFLGQLKERYGDAWAYKIWEQTNRVFDYLPLAATIDDVIFCVHGGIPRPLENTTTTNIELINHIPTPYELTPNESSELRQLVTDLLWADPAPGQQEDSLDANGFGVGERGPGAVCFGQKAVEEFIQNNDLSHILRAHEPTASGVSVRKGAKVITIFSTSKDHNCENAFCGCILVDGDNIIAINHPDMSHDDNTACCS